MRTESRSCCIKKTKTLTMSGTEWWNKQFNH
jgi:hypothetical protein